MEAVGFCRANDYLILIIRESNIFASRGWHVRTPTWDISGDQPGARLFLCRYGDGCGCFYYS